MPAKIQYRDIGDYFNQTEKLQKVKELTSLLNPAMQLSSITPNEENDWLNQRDGLFDTFIPIGDKDNKDGKTIFASCYSCGVKTNRDSWVYNFSESVLTRNISSMIDFYNDQIQALRTNPEPKFDFDSTKISWSDTLKQRAAKGLTLKFDSSLIATAMYRRAFFYFLEKFSPPQTGEFFESQKEEHFHFSKNSPGETGTSFCLKKSLNIAKMVEKRFELPTSTHDLSYEKIRLADCHKIPIFSDKSENPHARVTGVHKFLTLMPPLVLVDNHGADHQEMKPL